MYRQSERNLLNSNISYTCPHNMVNFGPLAAEINWWVCGTPAYLNGYRVLASLLQRRCSTEVNRTLHDVWPSAGLVYYIYIFGGCCPLTEFYQVQNSLCVQVLRSPIFGSVTARHWNSGRQLNFAAWYKEWNYGTFAPHHFQQRALAPIFRGRPSRWA